MYQTSVILTPFCINTQVQEQWRWRKFEKQKGKIGNILGFFHKIPVIQGKKIVYCLPPFPHFVELL